MRLADNTIVVFTSDHGEMAGAHRLRQKGPVVYRENLNVPFMVVHPDVKGARTTQALGSAVDILPTLYALAGGRAGTLSDPLGALPGHDLGPTISSASGKSRRDASGSLLNYAVPLYIDPDFTAGIVRSGATPDTWGLIWESLKLGRMGPSRNNRAFHRGVFDGRFKFARFFAPSQHHIPKDWDMLTRYNDLMLYDTKADPNELQNLALEGAKYRDLLLALNRKTNALIADEIGADDGREQPGPDFLYKL